jgi:uncharacterized coiled-coil DUF342 family protein
MATKSRRIVKKDDSTKFSEKLTQSLDDIGKMIEGHKEMIDSIQEVAIELTGTFITLHNLTVKYAKKANDILDAIIPITNNLPIVPKKIKTLLWDMEKYTQNIIDDSKETAKTIKDVNLGLKTGNIEKLKSHTGDLKSVTKKLTSILPKA